MVNLAAPWKSTEASPEPPSGSPAAESESEPSEIRADVIRSTNIRASERAEESRERDISGSTRADLLEKREFRALFYSQGLSPTEVMDLLDLSPEHVGTLMRIHSVAGFGLGDKAPERINALCRELSDDEWSRIVE